MTTGAGKKKGVVSPMQRHDLALLDAELLLALSLSPRTGWRPRAIDATVHAMPDASSSQRLTAHGSGHP